jgi:hypothetical protein
MAESAPPPRKDRLIQTRVPRDLEATLKQEARRRRLTVSHLIRSVLEDAFDLVDDVVADVDEIVGDSARLARSVREGARRLVSSGRGRAEAASPESAESPTEDDSFPHVYAWNELVLNRSAICSRCGASIARGERGFFGVSDEARAPRAWLCVECVRTLPAA